MKKSASRKTKKLEVLEKKLEIERKKLEIKKENIEIDEILRKRGIAGDEQYIIIHKAFLLLTCLTENSIDPDKTILGSEPVLRPLLLDSDRETVMEKMMELINQF